MKLKFLITFHFFYINVLLCQILLNRICIIFKYKKKIIILILSMYLLSMHFIILKF